MSQHDDDADRFDDDFCHVCNQPMWDCECDTLPGDKPDEGGGDT